MKIWWLYVHEIELSWDALQIVQYLGHSATKYRVTFHIPQLQLQIKLGFQLSVHFILRFESSEEVTWGWGSQLRVVERGRGTRTSKKVGQAAMLKVRPWFAFGIQYLKRKEYDCIALSNIPDKSFES